MVSQFFFCLEGILTGKNVGTPYSTTFYADDDLPSSGLKEKCQNDTFRSDTMAQPNVPSCHSKHTKTNPSHLNKESNSDSSGFAASFDKEEVGDSSATCSHIVHLTIRNKNALHLLLPLLPIETRILRLVLWKWAAQHR